MSQSQNEEFYFCDKYDVVLKVGSKQFFVEKHYIAGKCKYFEAMFGGHFVENSKDEIVLKEISAESIKYFLNYFYHGLDDIELLESVTDIIETSNFLQIPNFESVLDNLIPKINLKSWCQILQIAKLNNLSNVKKVATFYGLYYFSEIRKYIEYISDFQTLIWYLSHSYLKVDNEIHIFEAAMDWLRINKHHDSNDILIILSCLNYQCLDELSLSIILDNSLVKENSLAINVLLGMVHIKQNINKMEPEIHLDSFRDEICKIFDLNIYQIMSEFLNSPERRVPLENPCIAGTIDDRLYLLMFDIKNNEMTKWLDIGSSDFWGYNVVSWNTFKILVVCGETNKGRNIWNKEIKMYNCLEKKWSVLNSKPVTPRRHGGCVLHNDYIYLIGGVGNYRISLKSVVRYNLTNDTWETLPDLPVHCQSPMATFHNNELYVSAESLYVLRDNDWVSLCQPPRDHGTLFSYMNKLNYTINSDCLLSAVNIEDDTKRPLFSKETNNCVFSSCISGHTLYCWSGIEVIRKILNITICYLDTNCKFDFKTIELKPSLQKFNFNLTQGGCLYVPNFEIEDIPINEYKNRWQNF